MSHSVVGEEMRREAKTVSREMLALSELDAEQIDALMRTVPGGAGNVHDVYPLSPLQEGLLFHHVLNERSDTYVLSILFELESRDRMDALVDAVQQVIDSHEALRTSIIWDKLPRPVQVVYRRASLPVQEVDLHGPGSALEHLTAQMKTFDQPFDIRQAPLVRMYVAAGRDELRCHALLQVHHLICDHQSLNTIVAEISAHLEGRELPPSPAPYRDYVADTLMRVRKPEEEAFFRSRLSAIDEPTAPFGIIDVHQDGSRIEEKSASIDPALQQMIRAYARHSRVSAARLFHAAWALVVARTSGRDDVVFGTVAMASTYRSAGAPAPFGLLVNTLPLRLRLQGLTANGLVEETHRELKALVRHDATPLARAQRCSSIPGTAPLFTSLLNYRRSTHVREPMKGIGIRVISRGEAWANYPITVTVDDFGDDLVITAKADRSVGAQRMIEYLCAAMHSLIEALEGEPQASALTLSVLHEVERRQVIEEFNATRILQSPRLIHEMFEEQVLRVPTKLAAVYDGQSITYNDLNEKANQLARYLRDRGVGPDKRVALCLERSLEMVVALLAVLKAGGAYVPLDPVHPRMRLAEILEDSDPAVILTQSHLSESLQVPGSCELVLLDMCTWQQSTWASLSTDNLGSHVVGLTPSNLAYVMYTSGSTGKPKGVMVEHRNVVHFLFGLERCVHGLEPLCDRIAWNSSLGFDGSVKAWGQLTQGRTIYLIPEATRLSGDDLIEFLERHDIQAIECTPAHFQIMRSGGFLRGRAQSLRKVILGADVIDSVTWAELAGTKSSAFFNMYGPTECTVDATCGSIEGSVPHIGRVMPNARVYLLDAHLQPVPVGVVGALFIGGAGVARGYLKRPELTAERFLHDPYGLGPQARMYKTGDLARWRADGSIEYVGRNDFQVKIRGIRIEPGEIEAQALQHSHVKGCVVIAREDVPGDKRLVAYVVPTKDSGTMDFGELRLHLKASLPDYMIPSAFVMIPTVPLTPNGKLDRAALPAPGSSESDHRHYEAPRGEVEEVLAGIWQSLLRVERVGRHDTFFGLGGHSLLIVQMIDRLRRLGLSIAARRIFESPTLADLAGAMTPVVTGNNAAPRNLIPATCDEIKPEMLSMVDLDAWHIERIASSVPGGAANIQDIYPLAPLQEGILFHRLVSKHARDAYCALTLLSVSSREKLDDFVAVLQKTIDRHDILRTAIWWEELPQAVQVVYRRATLPVQEVELDSTRDPAEQLKDWLQVGPSGLDLRLAPLLRLQIAADPLGSKWYVLMQLHHIVADATSMKLLISEVVEQLEGRSSELPRAVAYREHVAQTLAFSKTNEVQAFFRSKLGDVDEPCAPYGVLDVYGDGTRIEEAQKTITAALTTRLRAQARRVGVSAATLFHTAWSLVVAHTSMRADVVFGTVLLGRISGATDAQRTLGMFINTLPMRLRLEGVAVRELVENTQKEIIGLLSHEQASLALAQRCSGLMGSTPLFTTLVNYRHADTTLDARWAEAGGIELLATRGLTNYPITFSIDDHSETFRLTLQTDSRLDPHRIIGYVCTAVTSLISALEHGPQTQALELTVLSNEERQEVIERFNDTLVPYAQEKLVHQLFEEQVDSTPDSVALIHEEESLTYAELDRRANQFANYLRGRGIRANHLVAICVDRTLEMVVGLLGILKAGAAYMPLDPSYPSGRLEYMLRDASPQLVLSQQAFIDVLPTTLSELINIDGDRDGIAACSSQRLSTMQKPQADDLLYVIYTSGSTGMPKGIQMTHRAMTNLIQWHRRELLLESGERVLQFAALSFDVAFQEIFSTLCAGGSLVLVNESIRKDAGQLSKFLSRQRIARLFVPPVMLQALAEARKNKNDPLCLEDVIVAGEQLRISSEIIELFEHQKGCRLHNHYGPTETHVVTAATLTGEPRHWPVLPSIGKPIANTRIYILDDGRRPVPLGVVGEIYIGGANVARGYLDREELTAKRFLPDPFSANSSARMYKTGDLGRWRDDGTIEYLGRNDDQVKIRGFRIELGEIEAQIACHDQVRHVAVTARADMGRHTELVAYIVAREPRVFSVGDLQSQLKGKLPGHMIPTAFVVLDKLPLTPSGKLDRRALPAPNLQTYATDQGDAPVGEIESELAAIWREVLHVDRVDRGDSFFDLGGHSLSAMRLAVRVESSFSIELPIRLLFQYPALKDLATHVDDLRREKLLASVSDGGIGAEALLERVTSMSEREVHALLGKMTVGDTQ